MKQSYLIAAIIALVLVVIIVGQRARINKLKAKAEDEDGGNWYDFLFRNPYNPANW